METDTDTETDEEEPDEGIEMDEGLAETYRRMLAAFTDGNNPPWSPAGEEPGMVFCAPSWEEDIVSWDSELDEMMTLDDVASPDK